MLSPAEEFISQKTLGSLLKKLISIRKTRRLEIDGLNELFGNVEDLAKAYIEPDCQHHNPADSDEDAPFTSDIRAPVFRTINAFLAGDHARESDGRYHLFVLADAGMGKSSLLCMLKVAHLTAFFPKQMDCILLKLGTATEEQVRNISNKSKVILLLDALDEDPLSWGSAEQRITSLLHLTAPFHRTIITCRTQFFPEERGPDGSSFTGTARLGAFRCPLFYLSLFDDSKVDSYLRRRFRRFWFFTDRKQVKAGTAMLKSLGSLRFRPLLLAHIEDLLASQKTPTDEYGVYEQLLDAWIRRESAKLQRMYFEQKSQTGWKGALQDPVAYTPEVLTEACTQIAVWMHQNLTREISGEELTTLTERSEAVASIRQVDIKGRSLLNRNSSGAFRFSHYSIQQFLVVRMVARYAALGRRNPERGDPDVEEHIIPAQNALSALLESPSHSEEVLGFRWTPQMVRFLRCIANRRRE